LHFAKADATMLFSMVLSDRTMNAEIAKRRIAVEPVAPAYFQPVSVDIHLGRSFWFLTVSRYYEEFANKGC